jgi:hypothetical protein
MRYPDAITFPGMILWAGNTAWSDGAGGHVQRAYDRRAPRRRNGTRSTLNDPRTTATTADLQAQFEFLIQVRDKTSEANNAVRTIRNVRAQIEERVAPPRACAAMPMRSAPMAAVEEEIYQVRNQSSQDPLNFPIKINNKIAALAGVASSGPYRPTDQTIAVYEEVSRC